MAVEQAGGVVLRGRRVVLRMTSKGEHLFPKGHVEAGETAEQAAVREIAEETGLQARIVASLGPVSYAYEGEDYRVEFFLMSTTGELPDWQHHLATDTVVVPREQVHDLLSFDSYRQLWLKAQRLLALLNVNPSSSASIRLPERQPVILSVERRISSLESTSPS